MNNRKKTTNPQEIANRVKSARWMQGFFAVIALMAISLFFIISDGFTTSNRNFLIISIIGLVLLMIQAFKK